MRKFLLGFTFSAAAACGDNAASEQSVSLSLPDDTATEGDPICWDLKVVNVRGETLQAEGRKAGNDVGTRICGRNTWDIPCRDSDGVLTTTVWFAGVQGDTGVSAGGYLDPCPDGCRFEARCNDTMRLDATLVSLRAFGIEGYVQSGHLTCDGGLISCTSEGGSLLTLVTDRRETVPKQPRAWLVCGESASCEGVADGEPTFPDGMKTNPNAGATLPSVTLSLGCSVFQSVVSSTPAVAASDLQVTCGGVTRTLPVADLVADASDLQTTHGSLWVSGTQVQWELHQGVSTQDSGMATTRASRVAISLALDTEGSGETCSVGWLAAAAETSEDLRAADTTTVVRVVPAFRFGGASRPVADAAGLLCMRATFGANAAGASVQADFQPGVETSLELLPIAGPWVGSAR